MLAINEFLLDRFVREGLLCVFTRRILNHASFFKVIADSLSHRYAEAGYVQFGVSRKNAVERSLEEALVNLDIGPVFEGLIEEGMKSNMTGNSYGNILDLICTNGRQIREGTSSEQFRST
jgi:hypothetical protein